MAFECLLEVIKVADQRVTADHPCCALIDRCRFVVKLRVINYKLKPNGGGRAAVLFVFCWYWAS